MSKQKVGTKEFAAAVIERLGQNPNTLKAVAYKAKPEAAPVGRSKDAASAVTALKGIDVFVHWPTRNANSLADAVGKLAGDGMVLDVIDNRGVKVWPAGRAETFCTDSFRCRFLATGTVDQATLMAVPQRIAAAGIDIAVTQTLRTFDNVTGYSAVQGQ